MSRDNFERFLQRMIASGKVITPDFFDEEEDAEVIGKVPRDLLKRYRQMNNELEMLHKEIEVFAKQLEIEAQRQIDEKFGQRQEEVNDLKNEIWDAISDAMGVSRDRNLTIDIRDGSISADHEKPKVLFDEKDKPIN